MKHEIEQAVDKLVEQEPGFDQVDFGDTMTQLGPGEERSDEYPYPQGEPTQWYGVFHCFSRTDEWHKRVQGVIDTEDPLAAGAVLLDAAYFLRTATTRDDLALWRGGDEPIFSYPEIVSDLGVVAHREDNNAVALQGEEWNGGVGRTQADAERMYALSEPGPGDGNWEEV